MRSSHLKTTKKLQKLINHTIEHTSYKSKHFKQSIMVAFHMSMLERYSNTSSKPVFMCKLNSVANSQ